MLRIRKRLSCGYIDVLYMYYVYVLRVCIFTCKLVVWSFLTHCKATPHTGFSSECTDVLTRPSPSNSKTYTVCHPTWPQACLPLFFCISSTQTAKAHHDPVVPWSSSPRISGAGNRHGVVPERNTLAPANSPLLTWHVSFDLGRFA